MNLLQPLWLLALPVILLPIWWHRQKRESNKRDFLATAIFLPAAAPQLMRVWRLQEILLLLLRCLLLLCVIAIFVRVAMPRYGDTVLIDASADTSVDAAWVEQEIKSAKFEGAQRLRFCAQASCELQVDHVFSWLEQNQSQWKTRSRILVLAQDQHIAFPAQRPALPHQVTVRTRPANKEKTTHTVLVHSLRLDDWRALFAAYEAGADGLQHYELISADLTLPNPKADALKVDELKADALKVELIIWDDDAPAPKNWTAPLWWTKSAASLNAKLSNEAPMAIGDGLSLQQAESAQGKVWIIPKLDSALSRIESAKALFQVWQKSRQVQFAFPSASMVLEAQTAPIKLPAKENTESNLLYLLVLLFVLERMVTHARRR
jgi:hypothetical protein